ncbi:PREDICTED: apolipoprotein B receptor [Chinchilla lanigera]|uniref:Apolipoprotein B receptor n=2 Tax=Chinchilla lanigera TaxID=34839 RepID=A0A8C2YRD5_CHILA|nr:PREDICTED: apolipoprotein B receptor [Chinchilla lanigera]
MEFLRQYLPALHQALMGALDSLSTFVSYLMGDAVPTVEREARELGEVAAGKPGKVVEEEAQEALHGLGGGQSEGAGGREEASSAAEQVWGWGEGSSCGPQAGRQDSGAWGAVTAARGLEPSVLLEAEKSSEAGTRGDTGSQAKERQEPEEQEVNTGETLRTWEQEEEEEVRAREPGMARGVESGRPGHREPKGQAGAEREKVAGDCGETRPVLREVVAEAEVSGAEGPWREEGEVAAVRADQSTRAQGTQDPGPASEDWTTLHKEEASTEVDRIASDGEEASTASDGEEASTASAREEAGTASAGEEASTTSAGEEADLPGVRETEDRLVPGDRISEAASSTEILEEASNGDQEEEPREKREDEMKVFPQQPWVLVTEATEYAAEGQKAEEEAAGAQEPEEEAGERFAGETDQYRREAQSRQSSEVRADGAHLQEAPAEGPQEKEQRCWAPEDELAPDQEAEGEADSETALEARPEEEFMWVRGQEGQMRQEAVGMGWGVLKFRVAEDQGPELVGEAQTPAEPPEEGQGSQEERSPGLSTEETGSGVKEQLRHIGSVLPAVLETEGWGLWWGGDAGSKIAQEEGADAEEEAAGGLALEAEAKGVWESELPEVLECGLEEGETSVVENQELQADQGAEAGTGQALAESEAGETKDNVAEVTVPQEADRTPRGGWRPQEATLRLQDCEDTQASPLAAEVEEGQAEGAAGAARSGELGRGWEPEGQGEAAQVPGEEELEERPVPEQRGDGEGQHGDRRPEGEAARPLDVDAIKATGGQRTEAEGTAPADREGSHGQEGQPTHQPPAETTPAPSETAEATGSDPGDTHSSWSEALLPGSRLDVSASRSRVLLSRSSWKRRSRPSSWRTPSPERQEDPPRPQPEEGLANPEQTPVQLEEAPEPSPSQSEETPEPVKRKVLGHGFGLAHPGMMQELQARLVQRKPQ